MMTKHSEVHEWNRVVNEQSPHSKQTKQHQFHCYNELCFLMWS